MTTKTTKTTSRRIQGARLLDEAAVLNLISLPRSTMYELLSGGGFPKQVNIIDPKTGQRKRIARWKLSDIEHWISKLPTS